MHLKGSIISGYTNQLTGLFSPVAEQDNLLLYGAADIMAGLLAGTAGNQVTHMYFQYINQSSYSYTPPAITRSSGRSTFDALTGLDYIDYLRAPIFTTPRIAKSPSNSTDYQGNSVMFTATSANVGQAGEISGLSTNPNYFAASGAQGASRIFSVALAAATDPENPAADKIFSRLNLATPLTVLAGSQPTIFWSIRIS